MSEHRVALVTAGASGIGRAIAERLLADGISVHICDINETALHACTNELVGITGSCCDVSDATQVEGLFAEMATHYDRLDILINNAGIAGPTASVEDIAPEDWDRTIAVDLNSAFYVTRLAAPLLKKSGGSIVNMASNAALFGFPLRSPYTAAKWAIIGLTKTWAMELGPDGVNVNALCPGSVNGPRIENVINKDAKERGVSPNEIRDVYQRQSSMRLFVDAEDIAETVRFLCSPAGHSISGQALGIDGHTEGLSNWLG
ncbi:SDR family oxidoreductase [Pseudohalioglobus sediminis]|uniref:SDR family oxidoreductase n=1 Tax=Pseudohalioglobus sediminis TaxID=2606449 RepID=A0A5B0WN55_9GAMM|nr:SDR family oxidoreductase [Pseudohalioglobus sediminis]KAA1188403.1 SDR family oxidoreductase [Pseudohalioglobus sediminis]